MRRVSGEDEIESEWGWREWEEIMSVEVEDESESGG